MQQDSRFPFIYNNAACPSDPCSHMHTHANACTLFQGRFSPRAMENTQQVQSSKNQPLFFFLEEPVTSSHFRHYNIYGEVWIHSFAPKLEVWVLYPGIFCKQKRITLLTWVFPLSNSFREPRKSVLQSTKICR